MFSLDKIIIQQGSNFYRHNDEIITGDNHSVSLANISLHYVIFSIAKILNKAVILKCFIDNIIWLSIGTNTTNEIQCALESAFKTNGLELTHREIQTSKLGASVEFLDMEHVIDTNLVAGFYMKDFVQCKTHCYQSLLPQWQIFPPSPCLQIHCV